MAATPGETVSDIEVAGLFGRYDVRLKMPLHSSDDSGRLALLYGDNGVGKTTILRSLFHLLSSSSNRGHKTFLLTVPFTRFSVSLSNAVRIEALREPGRFTGDYRIRLMETNETIVDQQLTADDGRISATAEARDISLALSTFIPFDLHYLGDDRRFESDTLVPLRPTHRARPARLTYTRWLEAQRSGSISDDFDPLADLLFSVREWIDRQARDASARGSTGTNVIYADVIRDIATPSSADRGPRSIDDALRDVARLGDLNGQYAEFDLLPEFSADQIETALNAAKGTGREPVVMQVLEPYLEGLEARIAALSPLYTSISSFVETLNSFFQRKRIRLSVGSGLEILSEPDGGIIDPSNLSSGERQLLLLFLNALFTRDRPSLFIVDEPELSLNGKWQRKMAVALLETTRASSTQFLMATHSAEILSGAQDRIVVVDPSVIPFEETLKPDTPVTK